MDIVAGALAFVAVWGGFPGISGGGISGGARDNMEMLAKMGRLNPDITRYIGTFSDTDTEYFPTIMDDKEQSNFLMNFYDWILDSPKGFDESVTKVFILRHGGSVQAVFEKTHFTWRDPEKPQQQYEKCHRSKFWIPQQQDGVGGMDTEGKEGDEKYVLILPKGIQTIGVPMLNFEDLEQSKKVAEVRIPPGVTSIGDAAFSGCNFTKIKLPESLVSIGENAFEECALHDIKLPEGLKSIGGDAFSGCNFTKIKLPKGLKSIGNDAFARCRFLQEIDLSGCTALTSIDARVFGNSVIRVPTPKDWGTSSEDEDYTSSDNDNELPDVGAPVNPARYREMFGTSSEDEDFVFGTTSEDED